ncbi:MAG: hypothetical protein AAF351_12640 [Pseudomonadota bacterium]
MKFLRIGSAALCAVIAAGCSDNDFRLPEVDREAPTVVMQFPSSNAYTDLADITVRGRTSDNDVLVSVTVNGNVPMTMDDFATWETSIALSPGINTITVEAADLTGNQTTRVINVVRQRGTIDRPFGSEFDTASDTLYFVDIDANKIMTITLADGEVAEFADLSQFVPTSRTDTQPLDLALDLPNDSIYLTVASDAAAGNSSVGIWRYDTVMETWSAFSDSTIDTNAVLQLPTDVMLDSANNRLLVIDFSADSVVAVSLADGSQSLLNATPAFPFSEPTDAAIDVQANRLLVTDRANDSVISVDLTTGVHTLLSDNNLDASPALRESLSITMDAANGRALIQDTVTPGIITVDLATGLRDGLSLNGRDPIRLNDARSLAIRGNEVLALDNQSDHLVAIDLDTEVRRIVTNNGFPRGSVTTTVEDIAATDRGVFGHNEDAALLVGGDDGFEVIAGSVDGGTQQLNLEFFAVDIESLTGYAVEDSGTSTSESRISTINLFTGGMQVISDGGLPNDVNPLDDVTNITMDRDRNRLLVLTATQILAVNLSDGARTVVSNDIAVPFNDPRHVYVDSANDRLLVIDDGYPSLIAVDSTGARSLFATTPAPGNTTPEVPDFLAIDPNGNLWLYDHANQFLELDAVTGARTPRIDVTARPRAQWRDMNVVDDVVYAVVNGGIEQIDLRTDESVIIYGSAPLGNGAE